MLKQPKPTDVIILQKRELLLQILHTHTYTFHVLSQHPRNDLINSCAGMITNKGVWLILPHVVQKVTTFHVQLCVERWVVQRNNNVMRI